MLNGYFIIFNTKESKNLDQLASRFFGNRVRRLQQLKNRPYNMKFTTFNWKGNDETFRKCNTKTGITNFKSNDGRRTQPSALELAAFYSMIDAWRNQKPYYNRRERKNKIRGKTVMWNEVEQRAKTDLNCLWKTDLFSNSQDANNVWWLRNTRDYEYDSSCCNQVSEENAEVYEDYGDYYNYENFYY